MVHYLIGRWGSSYGGRQCPVTAVPGSVDLIIMAPYLDKTFGDWFANPEQITWTQSWNETLELLKSRFENGARVAVVPNAPCSTTDNFLSDGISRFSQGGCCRSPTIDFEEKTHETISTIDHSEHDPEESSGSPCYASGP